MCAITASFSKKKLKDLYKLNSYRGELNYSLSTFDSKDHLVSWKVLLQDSGKMPDFLIDELNIDKNTFMVAHSQAPTTDTGGIHPAAYTGALLWHNGIIKQSTIPAGTWDTQWLLSRIVDYGWSSLSRVNGTFACVMFMHNNLYVFRNEISPLFIDDELNLSSTKFEGSRPLEPNTVFRIDLDTKQIYTEATFSTFENPYYFSEEVA